MSTPLDREKQCRALMLAPLALVLKNHACVNPWSVVHYSEIAHRLTDGYYTVEVCQKLRAWSSYMITHALSLIRDTRLPSRRLLRAMQTCWYKQVDFQLWNINPFKIFWLKTFSNWLCEYSFLSVPVGSSTLKTPN